MTLMAMPTGINTKKGTIRQPHPRVVTATKNKAGTRISTIGWYTGIRSPQSLHLPLSAIHETIGMLLPG